MILFTGINNRIMKKYFTFEDLVPPTNRIEAIEFFNNLFENNNPLIVEIGSGNGHFLVDYAFQKPDYNFIGTELLGGRAKKFYKKICKRELKNIAVYKGDARVFIWEYLYDEMVNEFIILFPDPWPKKRHHKHRLIKEGFIKMLSRRLKKNGLISIATDHEEYRNWIIDEFKKVKELIQVYMDGYSSYPEEYPSTLFLERFKDYGKEIYFMRYRKA